MGKTERLYVVESYCKEDRCWSPASTRYSPGVPTVNANKGYIERIVVELNEAWGYRRDRFRVGYYDRKLGRTPK